MKNVLFIFVAILLFCSSIPDVKKVYPLEYFLELKQDEKQRVYFEILDVRQLVVSKDVRNFKVYEIVNNLLYPEDVFVNCQLVIPDNPILGIYEANCCGYSFVIYTVQKKCYWSYFVNSSNVLKINILFIDKSYIKGEFQGRVESDNGDYLYINNGKFIIRR
jgi:hypothetical protein